MCDDGNRGVDPPAIFQSVGRVAGADLLQAS
jgi:hypothetical protein